MMVMKKDETASNRNVLFCNIFDKKAHGIEIDYESYKKFKTYMRESFDELNHFNEISYNYIKNKGVAPLYRKDSNTELEKPTKMNME